MLEDKPIRAKQPTLFQRAVKWSRRHRALVWSAAALLLMPTVGSSVSTFLISREEATPPVSAERALRALPVESLLHGFQKTHSASVTFFAKRRLPLREDPIARP